ncbi:MAG TPA: hypothetical protein PKG48_11915, partial [Bacteroidales bacterium]|nr:hypothetical protein [Bacteroidales bacterium]
MMKSSDLIKKSLQYVAVFAAIFAMILCVLIIVNYIQIKRTDPLNTPALKVLVEQLHSGPGDDQLRQQIRELDLVARKAFFTNQWQVRMGGYLLFFSLLVVVICLKAIEMQTKKSPAEPSPERADFWHTRKLNRIWVIYTGVTLVAVSLLLVFMTNRDLGRNFGAAGGSTGTMIDASNAGNANSKDSAGNAGMQKNSSADSAGKSDTVAVNMDGYPTAKEIAGNFASFRGVGGNGIAFQKNIPVSWDGRSGKNIRWKTGIPLSGYNSPIIWNDRIFLTGANETRREVYCFDLNSGKILWKV